MLTLTSTITSNDATIDRTTTSMDFVVTRDRATNGGSERVVAEADRE